MSDDLLAEALASRTPDEAFDIPDDAPLTIAEVAERLHLSAHTIRYYERIGLVEVERDALGHRSYGLAAMRRLEFIRRMRQSGMSMADLERYLTLVEGGEDTVPQRLDVLLEHRDTVRAQVHDLQLALAAIEYKIATYGGQLDGQCGLDSPSSPDPAQDGGGRPHDQVSIPERTSPHRSRFQGERR